MSHLFDPDTIPTPKREQAKRELMAAHACSPHPWPHHKHMNLRGQVFERPFAVKKNLIPNARVTEIKQVQSSTRLHRVFHLRVPVRDGLCVDESQAAGEVLGPDTRARHQSMPSHTGNFGTRARKRLLWQAPFLWPVSWQLLLGQAARAKQHPGSQIQWVCPWRPAGDAFGDWWGSVGTTVIFLSVMMIRSWRQRVPLARGGLILSDSNWRAISRVEDLPWPPQRSYSCAVWSMPWLLAGGGLLGARRSVLFGQGGAQMILHSPCKRMRQHRNRFAR